MADQRILMNIPAGQRKPKPVPIGKKSVIIKNLGLSDGQVELSIPNLAADICDYKVIPYNSSQPVVTSLIDFFGHLICCYNNNKYYNDTNNELGRIELDIL